MDSTEIFLAITGVIGLVLGVWALIDLWRGPYTVVGKIGWTVGIIFLPIVIPIVYLVSRPTSKMQQKSYEIDESREDILREYGHGGDL
ncbi:MAG TPA: PLD nuclease N-terminal domain-containing protein [Acidimicrobiia bacterium]|nr:PLD nuclease N-terminal domain-containing protein [Acidimicrobiia bacterium]